MTEYPNGEQYRKALVWLFILLFHLRGDKGVRPVRDDMAELVFAVVDCADGIFYALFRDKPHLPYRSIVEFGYKEYAALLSLQARCICSLCVDLIAFSYMRFHVLRLAVLKPFKEIGISEPVFALPRNDNGTVILYCAHGVLHGLMGLDKVDILREPS